MYFSTYNISVLEKNKISNIPSVKLILMSRLSNRIKIRSKESRKNHVKKNPTPPSSPTSLSRGTWYAWCYGTIASRQALRPCFPALSGKCFGEDEAAKIDHFRVVVNLIIKSRLIAKLFIRKLVLFTYE